MRSTRNVWLALALLSGACSGGGGVDMGSCPLIAAAGGNNNSNPSYQWDQERCMCNSSPPDGSASGGSCTRPQSCAPVCCTCPGSSGWTFTASACMSNTCLDQAATCQAVLAADPEPCKSSTHN